MVLLVSFGLSHSCATGLTIDEPFLTGPLYSGDLLLLSRDFES